MMCKTVLTFGMCMATFHLAMAQAVYRTVDADGKVVYSDQPPVSSKTTYNVIKSNSTKATVSAQDGAVRPGTEVANGELDAAGKHGGAPAPEKLEPAAQKAVIRVMANDELIRQAESLCGAAVPASDLTFRQVATAWRERNGGTLLQERRVLNEVLQAEQRKVLEQIVSVQIQRQLAEVQIATAPAKAKWCVNAFADIDRGELDVQNRREINGVLTNVRRH